MKKKQKMKLASEATARAEQLEHRAKFASTKKQAQELQRLAARNRETCILLLEKNPK